MQDHRKLDVWQKSYQFTLGIYRICADLPLMLAKDLQMIAAERYRELEAELTLIRKMLHAFIKSLSRK